MKENSIKLIGTVSDDTTIVENQNEALSARSQRR